MTRVCCQALANLVTDNEAIASTFFPRQLELETDDNLIQCVPLSRCRAGQREREGELTLLLNRRLLASPDHGTLQAVLIFLLNSIHGNRERACVRSFPSLALHALWLTVTAHARSLLLGTSKAGAAILDRLMTIVSVLFDDETPEGIASEDFHSDIFQLSCVVAALPPLPPRVQD